jgi:hypothetical protein
VSVFHGPQLARTRLLASGSLSGEELERAQSHLGGCEECGREFAAVKALLALVAADPVRRAEPPISVAALKARVEARLASPRRETLGFGLRPALASAAVLVLALWNLPHPPEKPTNPSVSEESLDRIERTLTREQTIRYLSAAEDVIVNVSSPNRCRRNADHVDVGEESRRSRELLERRALLLGNESSAAPSAQPVLNDVENVLREVASLDPCASTSDLDEIHREVSRRQILLRIDLATRELEG